MKPHIDIAHQGTIGDESRVRMSFDENSIAHLMGVLTDLYSDPELAVIREYSTNAWDAHIAAGNETEPIHVTLPTKLNPVFSVKDYGTGMSLDDITENFSKYGWSSKRDNDNEVGMLGLGCKSALTYTSQFTMVSNFRGLQITVLVTREADGAGAVQIIDTMPVDARNGVEVRIPVKDPHHFNQRVSDFFRFWETGTVLINGEPPRPYEPSMVLDPDVWLVPSGEIDADYIIMGQVAYPVRYPVKPLVRNQYHDTKAIVRVPIGCIDFTPNREGLQMTKRTEETLHDIRTFIAQRVHAEAQKDIEAATTWAEAIERTEKWRNQFPVTYTYRGRDVPKIIYTPERAFEWGLRSSVADRASKIDYLRIQDAVRHIYVVGHRGNGVLGTTKERLKKWAEDQGMDTRGVRIVFVSSMVGSPWLDHCTQINFDDLRKIDIGGTKVDKGTGQYKTLDGYGNIHFTDNLLKPTQVWLQANLKIDRGALMGHLGKDVDCIVVGIHQEQKFKKEHPFIPSVQAYAARLARQHLAGMTPDQHFYMANSYSVDKWAFKHLDPARIMDPEFRALVERLIPLTNTSNRRWNALLNLCALVGASIPKSTHKVNIAAECEEMVKRYPLLREISQYDLVRGEHGGEKYYQYVNALYTLSTQQITYLP